MINISFDAVISDKAGNAFMMTNEAMVRGAIEADVKLVSFYPGSPTTEILDTFNKAADYFNYKFTIATNEKVALETATGAAMAGFRSLTSMKSVGLNVASDSFFSLGYTGVRGGLVVIAADDPYCHSSQTEEDGRFFGPNAYIPMLEPSNPAEAKIMVEKAFEISERNRTAVLIRTTTRVNHQSGMVEVGPVNRKPFVKVKWADVAGDYFTVGESARRNKHKLIEKVSKLEKEFVNSEFNFEVKGESKTGILTSGVGYCYAIDSIKKLGVDSPVLKVGTTYPLPGKKIAAFMKNLSALIVVEELSPYLEHSAKKIAHDNRIDIRVFGKDTGHFSEAMEYNVPIVVKGMSSIFGVDPPADYEAVLKRAERLKSVLPPRKPCFCAGCPHRATLWSLKQAMRGRGVVFNNDIGCYTMAYFPPLNMSVSLLSMGSSIGLSAGMSQVLEDDVVSVVGDSTFFHAALPGLINAVHHNLDITMIILHNEVTAMTGQQPHAATPQGRGLPEGKRNIDIEEVCRALGVKHIITMDSFNVKDNIEIIKRALDFKGPAVIISRRACALHGDRIKLKRGEEIIPNEVDKESCKKPHACIREFHCPAIIIDEDDRASRIQEELCDGCGVCARLCPFGVIHPAEGHLAAGGRPDGQ